MKIISFFQGEYPNGFAPMSYRLHCYLKALKSKGVDVEIIMPSDLEKQNGIFEQIPYSFVKATKQVRFNKLTVAKEHAIICGQLAKKCDILFTNCNDNLMLGKIATEVKNNNGKIIIEFNENPYSSRVSRIDTKLGLFIKRQYFLNKTLKKVDGAIVISQALADLVNKHKNKNTAVVNIPILSGSKEIKRNKTYQGIPYILHAGALSEIKDGVKAMLQAFALANKRLDGNLKFIFTCKIGFPSLLNWIDDFITKNNLEEFIEFKGIVPKEELDILYANCALAIVNKPSNAQNEYNFPTKLTELLPREIPIVVSKTGVLKNYFIDGKNAFLVEANNVEQIADKIVYIQKHPNESSEIAKNGKILAEKKFYYLNYADILQRFFEQITKT